MYRRVLTAVGLLIGLCAPVPALAAEVVAPARPMILGLTTWFAASPAWTATYNVSLSAPLGNTPWVLMTDYVPALGSGHLNVAHLFDLGPVTLAPSLGYRFFGPDARTIELGPEARLGVIVRLMPWLHLWAGAGYSPILANLNGGPAGSYLDLAASLVASYERVSLAIGYGGLAFNADQAGNPYGALAMGGPTVGILTRF